MVLKFPLLMLLSINLQKLNDRSFSFHRYPNPSSFSYERRFFCPFEYALQPPAWYKPEHIALEKPELPLGVSKIRQYRGTQCFMIPGNHGNYCTTIIVFRDVCICFLLFAK
jgi:hypothetical protein